MKERKEVLVGVGHWKGETTSQPAENQKESWESGEEISTSVNLLSQD